MKLAGKCRPLSLLLPPVPSCAYSAIIIAITLYFPTVSYGMRRKWKTRSVAADLAPFQRKNPPARQSFAVLPCRVRGSFGTAGAMYSCKRFVTGFPYIANWTLVDFQREPPPERICSLCGVIPSETVWTPCRHVFCRRCYQSLGTTAKSSTTAGDTVRIACPIDGFEFLHHQVRVDRSAPELFRNYPVACKNRGCLYLPTLSSYEGHIALCEHQHVLCGLCARRLEIQEILHHVRTDCRRGRDVPSATMGSPTGPGPIAAASQHAAKCEVVSQELKTLRDTIQEELSSFRNALQVARATLVEETTETKRWKNAYSQPTQDVVNEVVADAVAPSVQMGRELGDYAQEEPAVQSSTFVWKVVDFARLRNEALEGRGTTFSSEAFYTGGGGYRMYLQGSLTGHDRHGNICLGLYFILTAGSFDTSLSWPYSLKTSFILVDHINGGSYNVQGDVCPESEGDEWGHCFRKPRPGEDNEGFGFSQFISLDDLSNPEHGYVVDNSFTVHFVTHMPRRR